MIEPGPHWSGEDRFAIYAIDYLPVPNSMRNYQLIATTSLEGIGLTILTLRDEGYFTAARVGIFDRLHRDWLIDPWKGTGWPHV